MELKILKTGNLMGTPDVKDMLHEADPGSDKATALWEDIAKIKQTLGYNGQCTSLLLQEPKYPEAFPALVDPSWVDATPDSAGEEGPKLALEAISKAGIDPKDIKSILITHRHLDHFDDRLLDHLPNASCYAHPKSLLRGCDPVTEERFGDSILALNTPGHGCPHSSYIVDLEDLGLSVCLAGDLIMNQAHYLSRRQPLSFENLEQAERSLEVVLQTLVQRFRKYAMLFPGHGLPFFVPV